MKVAEAQSQIVVDLKNYVFQSTGGGSICTANMSQCITGYVMSTGEYVDNYSFSNGSAAIVDYTARTTGNGVNGGSYIGVIRSFSNNQLSCFANGSNHCTAPSNTNSLPEGIPESLLQNVASAQDDINSSNSDWTPRVLIACSKDITGDQVSGVQRMNTSTCAQTYAGNVGNDVSAVYVQAVPFGGNIGTHDALVIQKVETAFVGGKDNTYPDHVERYSYVNGFGRVREATSSYSSSTGQFTKTQGNNAVRNTLIQQINSAPTLCPQGTKSLGFSTFDSYCLHGSASRLLLVGRF